MTQCIYIITVFATSLVTQDFHKILFVLRMIY